MSKHGFFQITQKLFLRKGDLLLVLRDRKSGLGDLPGGRMNEDEFYEDWQTSISREIAEELGTNIKISIEANPILIHKHRVNDGNYPCIILGYAATWESGEIELSDEHDFMDWVNIQTYDPKNLFSEYMLEAIEIYLKKYA